MSTAQLKRTQTAQQVTTEQGTQSSLHLLRDELRRVYSAVTTKHPGKVQSRLVAAILRVEQHCRDSGQVASDDRQVVSAREMEWRVTIDVRAVNVGARVDELARDGVHVRLSTPDTNKVTAGVT